MKWKEFEKTNLKPLYTTLREICEEVHNQGGFFCNYCYQREGWYCFPCDKVRRIAEQRNIGLVDKILSTSKKDHLAFLRGGGAWFWN